MKTFEEMNYYEILEVPFDSSPFEIRQAYKDALSTYSEESLATYTLFTSEERGEILKKIEEAFFTLIDERRRAEYDQLLINAGKTEASAFKKREQKRPIPLFQTGKARSRDAVLERVKEKIQEEDVRVFADRIALKESISGGDLKEIRETIGIALEEVFEVTRINVPILVSIESDHIESLPPMIYLENFLRSYAKLLQVDADKIVEGYIKHIQNRENDSG